MKLFKILGAVAAAAVLLMLPQTSFAGTEHNLSGWAWSSNIGWVSMNCTNDNSCGAVDYGVNKNSDGTLTGYAWSSNMGWIQFGGLSGFPTGGGTQAQNANMNGGNLVGWVRAIGADQNGWDGWISLSGSGYGVSYSNGAFSGYAWGSTVAGWIIFDVQSMNPQVCTNCGVRIAGDASLDVQSGGTSIVGQSAVPYGTIPTFVWTLSGSPSCSVSKTSSGGTGFPTQNNISSSGSMTGNALTDATYTYAINCSNPTISKQVGFTVAPQPVGFSLSGPGTEQIKFVSSGSSDSESKSVYVSTLGNFSQPVTISITGFPTPPASTTFTYSLGGSSFSSNPPAVTVHSPYTTGTAFQLRSSRPFTSPVTVTLTGTASGFAPANSVVTVTPSAFSPSFKEF